MTLQKFGADLKASRRSRKVILHHDARDKVLCHGGALLHIAND